jgi:hypothetical protein
MLRRVRVFAVITVFLVACGGPRPPDVAMATEAPPDAGVRLAPDSKSPKKSTEPSAPPAASADLMRCGCQLCEPVFSDDACQSDGDCGPSAPCHADRCVGIAKAKPRQPGDMCTLVMMCTTTDANACGCLNGKCALYARKK